MNEAERPLVQISHQPIQGEVTSCNFCKIKEAGMNVPASGRLLRQLGHPNFRHTGRTIECSNPRCVHPRSKAMKSAPLCLAQTEPRVHDVPAARGTGQKPRRLRRSASAREDLRTAIKTSPGLEVPALDLTLDRRIQSSIAELYHE
jgi:hypothetical protein